jgi:hypothetical protein
MNLTFRNVFTNLGRIYAEVEHGKSIDITGALTDPVEAIDLVLAQERLRQIAERTADNRAWAMQLRDEALGMNEQTRGVKL